MRGEMRGVEFCEKKFSEVGEKLERIEKKKCFSTRRWPGIGDSNGGGGSSSGAASGKTKEEGSTICEWLIEEQPIV